MFIKNLDNVSNCGIFYDWPKGHVSFGRYNLIYGWNGSGKTTLSRILRSLEKEEIDPALTKNEANPKFQFLQLDDTAIKSSNLSGWQDNVRVFNRDFIEENIHIDNAEAEPVYHLGEGQGDALEELEKVEKLLETANSEYKEKTEELQRQEKKLSDDITNTARNIRETIALSNYDARKLRPILEEYKENETDTNALKLSEKDLKASIDTARNSNDKDRINDEISFVPDVGISDLHQLVSEICERSVSKAAIDEFDKDHNLRKWAEKGHDLHEHRDTCAYCASVISTERKSLLDQYFNTAYETLIKDIENSKGTVNTFIGCIDAIVIPDESKLYSVHREKYSEIKKDQINIASDFKKICKQLSHSLDRKRESLTNDGVVALVDIENAQKLFTDCLIKLQGVLDAHNEQYDHFEDKSKEAKNRVIQHYGAEHYSLYLKSKEDIEALKAAIEPLAEHIAALEEQKTGLNEQLSEHHIAVERINELLASFIGRDDIKLVTNEKGYFIEREGIKAEHLSEGERTAIAFTYFIAKIEEKDFNIEDSIIVIDDPISSLDTNALYSSGAFIRCHLEKANQLFIFTHNYHFFREMYGWISKIKNPDKDKWHSNVQYKSHIMMKCETGEDGKRAAKPYPMDKTLGQYESEYLFLFKQIYEAYQTVDFTGENSPDEIAKLMILPNIARRLLEIFILFKFPNTATGSVINLYNVIKTLDVDTAKEKIGMLDRLLNRASHGTEDGVGAMNMLEISETPKAIQYVLEFIKDADPIHFKGLEEAIKCKRKPVPPEPFLLPVVAT